MIIKGALYFLHENLWRTVVFSCFLLSTCGSNEQKIQSNDKLSSASNTTSTTILNDSSTHVDTVVARTAEDILKNIQSNRVIKLVNHKYILKTTLLIDSIKNLKIAGSALSELMILNNNSTVLKLSNSYNINLHKLIIGHTKSAEYIGEQGVLTIRNSDNIEISNCKLLGSGTIGLVTYDVSKLNFINSEITKCSVLIFDLEKSQKIEFRNSKFHNNNLAVSVLGGFTNSTKDISFVECEFLNNIPDQPGNPAFNFYSNYKEGDLEKKISFTRCILKNNKGFKWYGDNIKIDHCQIDSTDFINFQGNNKY